MGKVLVKGQGAVTLEGSFVSMDVEIGDTVVFNKFATTKYKENQVIVGYDDVFAIVDPISLDRI